MFESTLTNADLTVAVVTSTDFQSSTGFTVAQLYSSQSYRAKDLYGIGLSRNDLTGWDFQGQQLASANMESEDFARANLSGADLTNASLDRSTLTNADLTSDRDKHCIQR